MTIADVDGRLIAEGAQVEILDLMEGMLVDLPTRDAEFLLNTVGTIGEVDEILDGEVSVMLKESSSEYHFIRSPGNLLRVAG